MKRWIFLFSLFLFSALAAGAFFAFRMVAQAGYNNKADLNNDDCVNSGDLTLFAGYFLQDDARGDINNDTSVDTKDFALMMDSWNQCLQLGAGDYTFTIQSGGLTRSFDVHVPPSYRAGTQMPLVMNFHGGGSTPAGQRAMTLMNLTSNQKGFIAVYPQGSPRTTNPNDTNYFWNPGLGDLGYMYPLTNIKNINDVGFVSDLLDDMEERFTVNTKKVYATGMSNGGIMTHTLGCKLANRIAAIAPVEGELWLDSSLCTPSRAMPVLIVHGTADTYIPYNGGVPICTALADNDWKSVDDAVNIWRGENSCSTASTTQQITSDVSCKTYSSCSGTSEVSVCTVTGGGHTWSGGLGYIPPSADPSCAIGAIGTASANEIMWTFFSSHSLP